MLSIREDPPQQAEMPTGLSEAAIQVAVAMSVFLFLATVVTALRLAVVLQRRRSLQVSDYLISVSLIFYYSYAVTTYLVLTIGRLGYPVTDVEPWRISFLFKGLYYIQISYAVGMGSIKCSLLLLLKNIFGKTSVAFRRISWTIVTLCISWSVMTILIAFLQCRPLNYNWNLKDPAGHCDNQNAAFAAVGAVDIATDVMIIILPVPMVLARQLSNSKKAAIISVFALGLFTIGITVARMVEILNVNFATFITTGKMVFIWSLVEWGTALIVASAPLLRPLVNNLVRGRNLLMINPTNTSDKGHPLSSISNSASDRNNTSRRHNRDLSHEPALLGTGNGEAGEIRITEEYEDADISTRSIHGWGWDNEQVTATSLAKASNPNGGQTWAIEQDIVNRPSSQRADDNNIRVYTELRVE